MNLKEAQGIANETLRIIVTHIDCEDFKDFIGRELDITDETLDEAVTKIFCRK